MELTEIDLEAKITQELKEAIENGPSFGDSDFQITRFNVMRHESDSRKYRQVLLELDKKVTALRKVKINRKRNIIRAVKITAQLKAAAQKTGIPVVAMRETLPSNLSLQQWQLAQARAVAAALAK